MTEPEFFELVGTDVLDRALLSSVPVTGKVYEFDISIDLEDTETAPLHSPMPYCYCITCEEHYDYWDMLSGEDTRGIDRKLDEKAREEAKDELYGI